MTTYCRSRYYHKMTCIQQKQVLWIIVYNCMCLSLILLVLLHMHTLILSQILLAAWYLDWRLHRTFIIRILVWKLLPHLRSLVAVKIVFPCFSLVLILQFQHPSYHVFKLNLHSISLVNLPQISFLNKNFFCPFSLIIIGKLGNNTQMLNLSLEIYVTSLIRKGRKWWINRTKHINNKYCWKKTFVMAENANYIHVSKRRWRCDRDTQISRPKATKVQTWIIKDAQSVGKGVSFNITHSQFSADSRVFLYIYSSSERIMGKNFMCF